MREQGVDVSYQKGLADRIDHLIQARLLSHGAIVPLNAADG